MPGGRLCDEATATALQGATLQVARPVALPLLREAGVRAPLRREGADRERRDVRTMLDVANSAGTKRKR